MWQKQKPMWSKVLHVIYSSAPDKFCTTETAQFHDKHHALATEAGISGHDLMLSVAFLVENKLVEEVIKKNQSTLLLTEKGFNVAHSNEHDTKEGERNEVIAVGAALAGLVATVAFMKLIVEQADWSTAISGLIAGTSLVFGILIFLGIGALTSVLLIKTFQMLLRK